MALPTQPNQVSNNLLKKINKRLRTLPVEPPSDHSLLVGYAQSKTAVQVHFLDGEVVRGATIKTVYKFTILLQVGDQEALVFKNAIKRIAVTRAGGGQ